MKFLSKSLSVLFHPMMMVTYASCICFFWLPSSFEMVNVWKILVWIAASTILLPGIMVFFFKASGFISSWRMDEQRERNWPLLAGALIYLASFYVVNQAIPFFIRLFLLGAVLGILISLLINLRWKISLHMIGIGGLCGGMSMLMILQENGSPLILFTAFICAGMLGTARLYLGAHSPSQVFAGFLTGFASQFLLVMLSVHY